ncbi:TetR/AcrR family transcriptional regulator [Rhodococcus oryzae]|uniref:TetR/AcrR family transcriptional regulator n=1 Tax=Rhodococcus oryzae TaxID=2571143 RepID=A0ABY2RR57_9NOCA|nr:TetR/AcrR family transcriptional regulator [Rhodococcus oryzae]TJZ81537.1 TetR/AcrR family transcriptional regulator [Rhodococcus oryzae]
MARLTRSESQAQTRTNLIATARDLFLADGYAATSLEKVAEEAGYSKGAVYSNFRNKNELCLEVLQLIHITKGTEVAEVLSRQAPLEERLTAFEDWAQRTLGDVGWTTLEFEFMALARHDPDLRAALASSLGTTRGMVAAMLGALVKSGEVTLPMSVDDAASSILSMGIGLGIQRAIDPTLSTDIITRNLRALLTASDSADLPSQA